MNIKDKLTEYVETTAKIGYPAIIERFVLRNGKVYEPMERIVRAMTPKQCYANTAKTIIRNKVPDNSAVYVEGIAINKSIGFLFNHAWVGIGFNSAMDPTLRDNFNYEYMGVEFSEEDLFEESTRLRYWGLLDTVNGINYKFIFKKDPGLEEIVMKVRNRAPLTAI